MGVSLAGPKGRRGWEIELAGQGWVVQTGSGYFCSFLFNLRSGIPILPFPWKSSIVGRSGESSIMAQHVPRTQLQ